MDLKFDEVELRRQARYIRDRSRDDFNFGKSARAPFSETSFIKGAQIQHSQDLAAYNRLMEIAKEMSDEKAD